MEFDRISAGITDWLDGAGVGDAVVGIEHVGSTAVCGLWAKPIIDLDLVYADSGRLADVARLWKHWGMRMRASSE